MCRGIGLFCLQTLEARQASWLFRPKLNIKETNIMEHFSFETTKSIICRPGAIGELVFLCKQLNIQKPLLVTDPGIVSANLHESALQCFENAKLDCHVYKEVQADPSQKIVLDAVAFAKSEGVDGVIGFGGGSSMDTAKLVAVLTQSKQTLSDIFGVNNVQGTRLPLIQVPTTAGTGSEVTPISIVTTDETVKVGIVSSQLLPDIALLDPNLTLGLPPHVTAATGIDAMVHAIEAYTSKLKKNVYSDMLACKALSLMAPNIETAVDDGQNLPARTAMMLGATLAGQAFANAPVAAVHALAYPLGGHYHIPHGLSNSLLLPHVMSYNAASTAPLYASLAPLILADKAVTGNTDTEICKELIRYVANLIVKLGLPNTLESVGIAECDLPMLAKEAMKQQRLLVNNPRHVSEQNALDIYRAAYR